VSDDPRARGAESPEPDAGVAESAGEAAAGTHSAARTNADSGTLVDAGNRADAGAFSAAGTVSAARAALEAGQDALAGPMGQTIHAAREVIGRAGRAMVPDGTARRRRVARLARRPLPLLYDVHPEARRALPHPLGLRVIPVAEIAGSAVEPTQRGGDFLPFRSMRTSDWQARWKRLREANERLAQLPPIDVYQYGGRYWVMDGHNRVALALLEDQPEIDANVTELHLPGTRPTTRAGNLAPLLEESREAQSAAFSNRVARRPRREDDG
jgi:hypothetical protein